MFRTLLVLALLCLALAACTPGALPPLPPPLPPPAAALPPSVVPTVPTGTLDDHQLSLLDMVAQLTMDQYRVPGLAVAIVEDGKVVFVKGYGVTDLPSGTPVTPQTAFNTGGLAAQFTAAAIMQLVEQGKLDLDAPVTQYLPDFTMADERYREITVRQLLTHNSGVTDGYEADWSLPLAEMWQGFRQDTAPGARDRYLQLLASQQLLFAPGTDWSYADADYNLLGAVIEAVSGQSFESYLHDHIFAPLGMAHTTFVPADLDPALLAQPHVRDAKYLPVKAALYPYHTPWASGDGLVTSAEDLARWMVVGFNRGELDGVRILAPETYDLLWGREAATGVKTGAGAPIYAGFGWYTTEEDGKPVVFSSGMNLGFVADSVLVPDVKTGVVALGNLLNTVDDVDYADGVVGSVFDMLRRTP